MERYIKLLFITLPLLKLTSCHELEIYDVVSSKRSHFKSAGRRKYEKLLVIDGFGRTFSPGDLYDGRTGQVLTNVLNYQQKEEISKMVEKEGHQFTRTVVTDTKSITDRANTLGIKADVLDGLIHVEGSAGYLNNRKASSKTTRVSLTLNRMTHYEQLSAEALNNKQLWGEVLKWNKSTHVVVKILYGANAVFAFDENIEKTENKDKISGELKAKIRNIPVTAEIAIKGNLQINETSVTRHATCTFFGDIQVDRIPTSYSEAVELYKDLSSFITEDTTVPMRVWLIPMSLLEEKTDVKTLTELLEDYEKIELEINTLLISSPTVAALYRLRRKLEYFKTFIEPIRGIVRQAIRSIKKTAKLDDISKKLKELLNAINKNPFLSPNDLKTYLKARVEESRSLDHFFRSPIVLATAPGLLNQDIFNPEYDIVVTLQMFLFKKTDYYLQELAVFIRTQLKPSTIVDNPVQSIYRVYGEDGFAKELRSQNTNVYWALFIFRSLASQNQKKTKNSIRIVVSETVRSKDKHTNDYKPAQLQVNIFKHGLLYYIEDDKTEVTKFMFDDTFLDWLRPSDFKTLGFENVLIRNHKNEILSEYAGIYKISEISKSREKTADNSTDKQNNSKSCLSCKWFKIFEPEDPFKRSADAHDKFTLVKHEKLLWSNNSFFFLGKLMNKPEMLYKLNAGETFPLNPMKWDYINSTMQTIKLYLYKLGDIPHE